MNGVVQPGVLATCPSHGRYLFLSLQPKAKAETLRALLARPELANHVVGLGQAALDLLGIAPTGMRSPPPWVATSGFAVWIWMRGDDPGFLARDSQRWVAAATGVLIQAKVYDGFVFDGGRDLTGYVDGSENPTGDAARVAAVDESGGSFVAVQRWRHNFVAWDELDTDAQDLVIGRRIADNEEIGDAPPSAHVKRTAQETFEPEAFVLRRSMPYADGDDIGLMFVAFGCSFDAFEAQLARMYGREDGVFDALLDISTPQHLSYFWCPPVAANQLVLG